MDTPAPTARIHRLATCSSHSHLLALARFSVPADSEKGTRRGLFSILDVEAATFSSRPQPEHCASSPIRALSFVEPSHLVTVSDDKDIRLYSIEGANQPSKLLGQKTLVKRANAIAVVPAAANDWLNQPAGDSTEDSSPVVLVADKFGDAYRLSLKDILAPKPALPLTRVQVLEDKEDGSSNLLLGHVSMLTDIALNRTNSLVLTADRDEHIRVSQYPKTYNIEGYLLGHEQYISNVKLLPHVEELFVVSGGGDPFLLIWDVARTRAIAKLDLLKPVLANGGLVPCAEKAAKAVGLAKAPPRPFFHRKKQKGGNGDEGAAEDNIKDGDNDDELTKIAVARIIVDTDGTTAVLLENFPHILVYHPTSTTPCLTTTPTILSPTSQPIDAAFDHKHRLWVSLLEGPLLSLFQLDATTSTWARVESDPALDLVNEKGSEPVVPISGKGQEEAVDFFPFGKIRKRKGEDESGDEGGEDEGGEKERGTKRGKKGKKEKK